MEALTVLAGIGSLLFTVLAIVSITLIVASTAVILVYGVARGSAGLVREIATTLRVAGSHRPLSG